MAENGARTWLEAGHDKPMASSCVLEVRLVAVAEVGLLDCRASTTRTRKLLV
jgi:hypothetical protein